jgi:hypothetical protein
MQDGSGYSVNCCQTDEQAALSSKLFMLSRLPWRELRQAHRHGLGYEKIARHSIKAAIPVSIPPDANLIAFRFHGKAPMVGFRQNRVLHIVWLDRDFTLYPHE